MHDNSSAARSRSKVQVSPRALEKIEKIGRHVGVIASLTSDKCASNIKFGNIEDVAIDPHGQTFTQESFRFKERGPDERPTIPPIHG